MAGEPAKDKVTVSTTETAKVVAYPPNYWEHTTLNLYFKSPADQSVDDNAAKKFNKKANAPLTYVTALQDDLIKLGYITAKSDGAYGELTARAVTRFQRHARRVYRMKAGVADDVKPGDAFTGAETGICDQATATEIRKWIGNGWAIPVNRFPKTALSTSGYLRSDVAAEWEKIITAVNALGGTVAGPYGDTLRSLFTKVTDGASPVSFHYTGRAVDLNNAFGGGRDQRYYIAKDERGGRLYWRIYCKTELQDGKQGDEKKKGDIKCWQWAADANGGREYDIPKGYYIDLTAEIEKGPFERIPAHDNWKSNYKSQEWWHYEYTLDKQPTFLDEMELVGFTEKQLRETVVETPSGGTTKPWEPYAALDHKRG